METKSAQRTQASEDESVQRPAGETSAQSRQPAAEKPVPQDPSNKTIDNKANDVIEDLCQGFLVFVGIYFMLMLPYLWDMVRDFEKRGVQMHGWEYLLIFPSMVFNHVIYLLFRYKFSKLLIPHMPKEIVREGENAEQRRMRLGNLLYGACYYVLTFSVLISLVWGTDSVPRSMGGDFDAFKEMAEWPYTSERPVRLYYIFTLGHHAERAFFEIKYQRQNKTFYTMIFHHVLTIMLIFLSTVTHHIKFGVSVLLTHDFNDIFMNSCRLLRETYYQKATSVVFLTSCVFWMYSRIFTFFIEIIGPLTIIVLNPKRYLNGHYFIHCFFPPALLLLAVLNIFWAFQMMRVIFWRFFKNQLQLPFEDSKGKQKAVN